MCLDGLARDVETFRNLSACHAVDVVKDDAFSLLACETSENVPDDPPPLFSLDSFLDRGDPEVGNRFSEISGVFRSLGGVEREWVVDVGLDSGPVIADDSDRPIPCLQKANVFPDGPLATASPVCLQGDWPARLASSSGFVGPIAPHDFTGDESHRVIAVEHDALVLLRGECTNHTSGENDVTGQWQHPRLDIGTVTPQILLLLRESACVFEDVCHRVVASKKKGG